MKLNLLKVFKGQVSIVNSSDFLYISDGTWIRKYTTSFELVKEVLDFNGIAALTISADRKYLIGALISISEYKQIVVYDLNLNRVGALSTMELSSLKVMAKKERIQIFDLFDFAVSEDSKHLYLAASSEENKEICILSFSFPNLSYERVELKAPTSSIYQRTSKRYRDLVDFVSKRNAFAYPRSSMLYCPFRKSFFLIARYKGEEKGDIECVTYELTSEGEKKICDDGVVMDNTGRWFFRLEDQTLEILNGSFQKVTACSFPRCNYALIYPYSNDRFIIVSWFLDKCTFALYDCKTGSEIFKQQLKSFERTWMNHSFGDIFVYSTENLSCIYQLEE